MLSCPYHLVAVTKSDLSHTTLNNEDKNKNKNSVLVKIFHGLERRMLGRM